MDCDVARESLSARIDGEREPVPSLRVDEHLAQCRTCAEWYRIAAGQSRMLQALARGETVPGEGQPSDEPAEPRRSVSARGARYALAGIGVLQLGLAVVQALGVHFGMVASHHGAASGAHLLNESTAWSAALGLTMIAAAARPVFAPGMACVAGMYALVLAYYVAADSMSGQVTVARAASHLPVVLGVLLALLVWRTSRPGDDRTMPTVDHSAPHTDTLSERRRRKLGATDDSAA